MGTIANIGTIPDILMELAKKVGENKNIIIGYENVAPHGGEWEFHVPRWQIFRNNDSNNTIECSLELTYWLAPKACDSETSNLTLSFPLSGEEKKKVIDVIDQMIGNIKLRVRSELNN